MQRRTFHHRFLPIVITLLISLHFANLSFAQIDASSINKKLLEHEIKILVDSTRISHNLAPLFNDSILYVASNHHANYLNELGDLDHFEKGKTEFYSPQDRANYYGAPKSYFVGENIVYAGLNAEVRVKGKTFKTTNYTEMARCLVYSWIKSKGHFKNMITPEYQVTGLAIAIDTVNNRVYACQKFAQVVYKYDFEENAEFFPYSSLDQDSVNALLVNFPKDLSYPFGLKYNEKEKCDECKDTWDQYPQMSVRIRNNYFILRVEQSDFVKELIKNRKDGFAIEMVPFDAFACGNPAYYDEPSRRNEMKRTSGRLLEPVYRKDLMKGFKRRKKKKDVSFVKYILSADSVSFFKRFGRYKLANFDAKYFEIKLGKVPKDLNGWWNHNLVYIHNKQICHFVYLTNYPGELDLEMIDVPYYPPVPIDNYEFVLELFSDTVELFYEPGVTLTSSKELKNLISKYTEKNLRITQLDIEGFCSVEGDANTNEVLHQERAKNIMLEMESILTSDTLARVSSEVAWTHFYENVKDDPTWKFLYPLSRDEITAYLTDPKNKRPLEILREERKVKVVVHGIRDLNKKNANYYIQRDWKKMFTKDKRGEVQCVDESLMQRLYEKAYYFSTVDTITVDNFLAITFPMKESWFSHNLQHEIAFYRYHHLKDSADKTELGKLKSKVESVFSMCGAAEHLSPEFHYLSASLMVDRMKQKGPKMTASDVDIQKAFDRLNLLLNWYDLDSSFMLNVAKANLNIVNLLIETVDPDQVFEHQEIINASLIQIVEYYRSTDQMNPERAVSLSKLLCYFMNINLAVDLCQDFLYDNEVLKLYLPLAFQHSSYLSSDRALIAEAEFQQLLMEAQSRLTSEEWCKLFYGQFGIPFQVMDNEPLHKAFCETCPNRVDEVFAE